MINSIIITNLDDAISASFKDIKQNLWISSVDEEDRNKIRMIKTNLTKKGIPHFVQYFCDWSDEDDDIFIVNNLDDKGPKEQNINNIISFLETYVNSDEKFDLGVNCYAGVSRSTAIGIIAWVMQGKNPTDALEEIKKVRPMAWPNLRVLRFASNRLGKDLMTPVKEWKNSQKNELFIN